MLIGSEFSDWFYKDTVLVNKLVNCDWLLSGALEVGYYDYDTTSSAYSSPKNCPHPHPEISKYMQYYNDTASYWNIL